MDQPLLRLRKGDRRLALRRARGWLEQRPGRVVVVGEPKWYVVPVEHGDWHGPCCAWCGERFETFIRVRFPVDVVDSELDQLATLDLSNGRVDDPSALCLQCEAAGTITRAWERSLSAAAK